LVVPGAPGLCKGCFVEGTRFIAFLTQLAQEPSDEAKDDRGLLHAGLDHRDGRVLAVRHIPSMSGRFPAGRAPPWSEEPLKTLTISSAA